MIRKAAKTDMVSVAEMAVMMWDSHSVEELKGEFEQEIENKDCVMYIYCIDNIPIGFAQCGLRHDYVEGTDTSPVGYLEGIFVEEEYRKRGIAKEMLDACQRWAKEQGCTEFASDCEIDNIGSFHFQGSLKFHLKMGFSEANRIICFTKRL